MRVDRVWLADISLIVNHLSLRAWMKSVDVSNVLDQMSGNILECLVPDVRVASLVLVDLKLINLAAMHLVIPCWNGRQNRLLKWPQV